MGVQRAALSRRRLLAGGAVAVVGAGGAWLALRLRQSKGDAWPTVVDGQPLLRMPFPAGTVVLCQQGNLSREGLTHALANCLHALDLSNPTVPALPVVAAAPGKVVFVFGKAALEEPRAGYRFGNQVKIQHDDGYFTYYAHLARVSVERGTLVRVGQPIGTVGRTGAAGNAHLHFSLHHGAPQEMGVHETTKMMGLLSADMADDGAFVVRNGADFQTGESEPWQGHLYGSENALDGPITRGTPPTALRERLAQGRERLEAAMRDRNTLVAITRSWESDGPSVVEEVLRPILQRDPSHPVARFWRARAVLIPTHAYDQAEGALSDLLRDGPALPTWETWLPSWIHNQLGLIAMQRGQRDRANEQFRLAYQSAMARPERRFALEHLRDLADAGAPK